MEDRGRFSLLYEKKYLGPCLILFFFQNALFPRNLDRIFKLPDLGEKKNKYCLVSNFVPERICYGDTSNRSSMALLPWGK